jgi:hypothetical protein
MVAFVLYSVFWVAILVRCMGLWAALLADMHMFQRVGIGSASNLACEVLLM